MSNETKTEVVTVPKDNTEVDGDVETISIPKSEYDKLNQTLGSLKRENKDLKKPREEVKETPTSKPDDALLGRLEKLSLRQAGITHQDDIDLAKVTAKKWGIDLEEVLADDDFKVKLERQQSSRDNALATSKIKGGAGTSQAKNTPEYWIAKGTPPSPSDVPDRKVRAKIARAMMSNAKTSKTFYND